MSTASKSKIPHQHSNQVQQIPNSLLVIMASYLPQPAHPQEILFKSYGDGKYLGSEMEYTYGDNKQKMTTAREDASILASNSPTHLLPVVKNLLKGRTVVSLILPFASVMVDKFLSPRPFQQPIRVYSSSDTIISLR